MTFVARCARSPFVLSILFCLFAGLWWGSAQFAASSVANKVNHPAQPVTTSPKKSLAAQGDAVSPHAFDWRKRGGNDAAYQRALSRACQMPAASEPFGIGGVWASLGPDKPALADDPCQNLKSLTARGLLTAEGRAQFTSGALSGDGAWLWGASEQGLWRVSAAGDWQLAARGTMSTVVVDPQDAQTLYVMREGLSLQRSRDGGQTFTETWRAATDEGLARAPLALSAEQVPQLWTGGRALWRSLDGGLHWQQASPRLVQSEQDGISALAISPTETNLVLAGASNGAIYRQRVALTAAWQTNWDVAQPRAGFVSSLVIDPQTGVVYATYATFGGAHVWRSTDNGASWTAIDGVGAAALPDVPVHALVIDPSQPQRIFLGTDLGVFVSTDGGQHWQWDRSGVGAVPVEAMLWRQAGAQTNLYAFTRGQGVWQMNLAAAEPEQNCDYTLTPYVQSFEVAGGNGSIDVAVRTGSNCVWTARSEVDWIKLNTNSGTGNGRVTFTVEPNATNQSRGGRIVLNTSSTTEVLIFQTGTGGSCTPQPITAGQPVNGTLSANDCPIVRDVRFYSDPYYGDRYSFSGRAGDLISLVMRGTGFEPEIFLVGPSGAVVAQTNFFSNEPNTVRIPTNGGFFVLPTTGTYLIEATADRTRITGAYQLLLTTAPDGCGTYSVISGPQRFDGEGGSGRVQVSAQSGCPWTASSTVDWVRVTSGGNGSGNQYVNFTVAANTTEKSRSTRLEVAGQGVVIEQAGRNGSCLVKLLEPNKTITSQVSDADCLSSRSTSTSDAFYAERFSFTATAGQAIILQASSLTSGFIPLITLTDVGGARLAEASRRIPAVDGTFNVPASGTYFVEISRGSDGFFSGASAGAYQLTLIALPAGCDFAINATYRTIEPGGGPGSLGVSTNAGCGWLALSLADWITVTNPQGSGTATVNYTVAPNTTDKLRRGELSVSGRTLVIEQAGTGGSCDVKPILPGQTISGRLTEADCRALYRTESGTYFADRYAFTGRLGEQVVFNVSGSAPVLVTLANRSGSRIASGSRIPGQGFLPLPADGEYVVEVTTGSGLSITADYTLSFNLVPAGCNYSLGATGQRFDQAGGTGTIDVNATAGCVWTAQVSTSDASWLTITTGATGSGAGKVEFAVAANTTLAVRTALLNIAGQFFTVEQAGAEGNCLPQPIVSGQTITGSLRGADCGGVPDFSGRTFPTDRYSFSGKADEQIAITSFAVPPASISSGMGIRLNGPNGQLLASAATRLPSSGSFFRLPSTGTYTIEISIGFPLTGTQSFPYTVALTLVPGGCSYVTAPGNARFEAAGGAGSLDLLTAGNCPWKATTNDAWITITSNATGQGASKVEYTIAPNTTATYRRGALFVGETAFIVEQAGTTGNCQIGTLSSGQTVSGSLTSGDCRTSPFGGTPAATDFYSFTGTQGDQIVLSTSQTSVYLVLRDATGRQLGEAFLDSRFPRTGFYALPTTGTYFVELVTRSGTPLNYTLSFDSVPGGCTYTVAPTLRSIGAEGGTVSFDVITQQDCAWRASSSSNWVTIATPSGKGSGKLEVTVAANTQTSLRTATLNLGDRSFTIEQGGANGNCAPVPLTLGQTVTGAISSEDCRSVRNLLTADSFATVVRADRYALDFVSGQQFALEFAPTTTFTPVVTILAPNGVILQQVNGRTPATGFMTLPANGKYVIEISPQSGSTGSYSLRAVTPTACAVSLTPPTQIFERDGGSSSVSVVTGNGCAWTATSEASWLTISGNATGTGGGTLSFGVAANTTSNRRTGVLRVGDQTLTITQAGAAGSCAPTPIVAGQQVNGTLARGDCGARFGGNTASFSSTFALNNFADLYTFTGRAGETISFSPASVPIVVLSPQGAPLNTYVNNGSSSSPPPALVLTLPADGTYTLEYSGNTVGNYSFTLLSVLGPCAYSVSTPSRDRFEAAGGSLTINVTTSAECRWRVTETSTWVTVKSGTEGIGNGVVELEIAPNSGDARIDDFFVAGKSIRIQQAGPQGICGGVTPLTNGQTVTGQISRADCFSSRSFTFDGQAGQQIAVAFGGDTENYSASLNDPSGRSIASVSRAQRLPDSGFVSLPVNGTYTLTLNSSTGFVLNYSLTLTVLPPGCAYTLSASSAAFESTGGTGAFDLTASANDCPWNAQSEASWVTVTPNTASSGSRRVEFTVLPNNSIFARQTRILAAGRVFTVQQAGLGGSCSLLTIAPNQTVSGSIDEADCPVFFDQGRPVYGKRYSFNGKAGEQVQITLTGPIGDTLQLLSPTGSQLLSATGQTSVSPAVRRVRIPETGFFTLPSDGAYVIRALSSSFSLGENYELSLAVVSATCSYGVDAASKSFDATGGTGSVNVIADASCPWLAKPDADWVTVTAGTSGNGNGKVEFTVAANPDSFTRRTTLFVANRAVTIKQAGRGGNCLPRPISAGVLVTGDISSADCLASTGFAYAEYFTYSGKQGELVALFGGLTFSGGTESGANLTLSAPDGRVLASATRTTRLPVDAGVVTLPTDGEYLIEIGSESSSSTLSYALTLQRFSAGCGYALSSVRQTFTATSSTGSVDLLTGPTCNWNATSRVDWITINSVNAAGTGNRKVEFTVAANSTNTARRGVLLIAGRSLTIEQAGGNGSCEIRPIANGQTINASLTSGDCRSQLTLVNEPLADRYSFTAAAGERILISASTGSSFDSVQMFLLGPDGSLLLSGRNGRLPVNAGAFVVPAAGRYVIEIASTSFVSSPLNYAVRLDVQPACSFAVTPTQLQVAARAGVANFNVTAGGTCDWLVQSQSDWLTLTPSNSYGSGNGAAGFSFAANTAFAMRTGRLLVAGQVVEVVQAAASAHVSAANYRGGEFAPESLVTAYGQRLATATQVAPVPVATLAGTTVKVFDSAGAMRDGLLTFVSPAQINYIMPAGLANGPATIIITSGDGNIATAEVVIAPVAPGLFSANGNGQGVAAGYVLRVKPDGTRSSEPIARYDETRKELVAIPIDLGAEGEQVFFIGFGSGVRGRSALSAVRATIGGVVATLNYAGPQTETPGLDQLNILLPRVLGGRGDVELLLTVDGKAANPVRLTIR